jgi:hypothetical protein
MTQGVVLRGAQTWAGTITIEWSPASGTRVEAIVHREMPGGVAVEAGRVLLPAGDVAATIRLPEPGGGTVFLRRDGARVWVAVREAISG